ncbi:Fur family transcriptional regulator [Granulicatella seriolae]|uniref:Transcriptional repressor n=1 Tax=Granulicatella seriolae TaxID=2967226 RepID=A0ABT1WKA3_9LACT|nr:Fur family transcriptional regulator [Granulicatella seriolae]
MPTQVDHCIAILKNAGYKYTKKRERLVEIFNEENRYLSARSVQELLAKDFPNLSYDTIYRNLYTYVELGILEETELNGEKLFRIGCMEHGHHHHHFICQECGRTKEIDLCPMDFFQEQLEGCKILSHRFEIFGLCPQCSAKA